MQNQWIARSGSGSEPGRPQVGPGRPRASVRFPRRAGWQNLTRAGSSSVDLLPGPDGHFHSSLSGRITVDRAGCFGRRRRLLRLLLERSKQLKRMVASVLNMGDCSFRRITNMDWIACIHPLRRRFSIGVTVPANSCACCRNAARPPFSFSGLRAGTACKRDSFFNNLGSIPLLGFIDTLFFSEQQSS